MGGTALSVYLTITTSLKTQFLILSFKSLSEASRFILGEQVWLGDSPVSSQTFPLIQGVFFLLVCPKNDHSNVGLGSSLRGEPGLTTFRSQGCP